MFSSCSVKCNVKMTFLYFITCYRYSIEFFKRDFTKPSFKHAKIIFLSVAFLYSVSILFRRGCHIGKKDVIIANSISSVHVKNACVYVGQMYSIFILFRRIDINIAFNSRQTPNFACNCFPPFQCLPLGHLL